MEVHYICQNGKSFLLLLFTGMRRPRKQKTLNWGGCFLCDPMKIFLLLGQERNSRLAVSRSMKRGRVNFPTGSLGMLTTLATPIFPDLCTLPTGEHNILYC